MKHTIIFLHGLIVLYNQYLPKQNIRINEKDLQSSCITREIKKCSKRKQGLYMKFLKNWNSKNGIEYINLNNFLNRLKNIQKELFNYFIWLIFKHKNKNLGIVRQ